MPKSDIALGLNEEEDPGGDIGTRVGRNCGQMPIAALPGLSEAQTMAYFDAAIAKTGSVMAALGPVAGQLWLGWQLRDGGGFDPKREYRKASQAVFDQARDTGNQLGGAVLHAGGWGRTTSQVGAGAVSLLTHGMEGAEGVPPALSIVPWQVFPGQRPYGDYNVNGTAEWVPVGWDYAAWKRCMGR